MRHRASGHQLQKNNTMDETNAAIIRPPLASERPLHPIETTPSASAVSWAAIFAGAAGAASLSLILLVLGSGLGLSAASPWATTGADAETLGVGAIVWIAFVAIVASGTGGYLAGRLRVKWAATHSDEVYFRDTAHGFLSWSIATLATAALLTSAIGSVVGTGAKVGGAAAGTAATAAVGGAGAMAKSGAMPDIADAGYFSDSMFRPAAPAAGASAPSPSATGADTGGASNAEAGKIFARSLRSGTLAPEDSTYLGQMVAQRTGMSQDDAVKRVNDSFAKAQASLRDAQEKAKEAADKARKAAAYLSLWLFVSLLLGAFTASFAATFGGRQRDI